MATVFFTLSSIVGAWEGDVHYGLTRWLALKAGFAPAVAEVIAAGDLSSDLGSFDAAPWAVGLHIVILPDLNAAQNVQRLHFPSCRPLDPKLSNGKTCKELRAAPEERPVIQNSLRSRAWITKDTGFQGSAADEPYELNDFGRALHSLQDSWSHEGVPDVALRCFGSMPRADLSWAHPQARGGWAVHDADLTYLWQADKNNQPLDMARATFEALAAYGRNHKNLVPGDPPAWDITWEATVERFIKAASKESKRQWFRDAYGSTLNQHDERNFLSDSSLPDFDKGLRSVRWPNLGLKAAQITCNQTTKAVTAIRNSAHQLPAGIHEFYDRLFSRWLQDRDVKGIVGDSINVGAIRDELRELLGERATNEAATEWASKYFTMSLLKDHGFVNESGHGVPTARGYGDLPMGPGDASVTTYTSVPAAIFAPGTGAPYSLETVEWPPLTGDVYVATFRFRDKPRDTFLLVAAQTGTVFRIVRMFWLVA